jgi:malonate-semialdehyde dehydrogenase (acetylating)/methylmalonate-semialdehyde dehydrogenase
VKPTILDDVPVTSDLADTEIFGPVLSLVHADTTWTKRSHFLERSAYGNQASLFTSSGSAARRFRYEAPAGNIGINIGVAAPMAYFPFSGWKNSFFGDLHGQGRDAIEFYTDKKVVVERWAKETQPQVLIAAKVHRKLSDCADCNLPVSYKGLQLECGYKIDLIGQ